jgi:hypothetical protein
MTTGNLQVIPSTLSPGDFTSTVKDNNGAPSSVLEAAEDFSVEMSWRIEKALSNIMNSGDWEASVYYNSLGSAAVGYLGSVKETQVAGTENYGPKDLVVPKNTFPDNVAQPQSGSYELTAVLTFTTTAGVTDIAAVEKLGVFRIA